MNATDPAGLILCVSSDGTFFDSGNGDCGSNALAWNVTETVTVNATDGCSGSDPNSAACLQTQTQTVTGSIGTELWYNYSSPGGPVSEVPTNACQYRGNAQPPAVYAAIGQAALGNPLQRLANLTGFPRGNRFDAQPLASGTVDQKRAYGNYVYGVYMAATGVSLVDALEGANTFALTSSYPAGTVYDSNFTNLPAANVQNIVNGFLDQQNGLACSDL